MRSYVDFRTEQLTESIDYLDHRDALRTHLEILKLQLLEAAKLPSLFSESVLDEAEYNRFRAEDYKYNSKIIESVINFAVDNLYEELINEVDAPVAATGPTADPKLLLTQLRDSLIKKIRRLMHDLRAAVTDGIEAARSEPEGTATADPAAGGSSASPAGSSAGPGAGSTGPSAGHAGAGAPVGGGAPMSGPTAAGPGGRSPMDTRPAWGSPRGHEYEGGFRPADYGSFRPSDGWMAGLRRTVVDPLMNSRPVKWLRRKWHGDPTRENMEVLGKIFSENALLIAQKFADAEKDLIGWVNQNIQDISKQMGFDVSSMNPAAAAPTPGEGEDAGPAPSVGMGEPVDGSSMPELAAKAAHGDQPSKIKWEYMKDAVKDLGHQFTGEDKKGVYQVGKHKGKDRKHYINLLHLIQNDKGTLATQFNKQSGPALQYLAKLIYPKVFGKPAPMKGALGKLQTVLHFETGQTHHDVNSLLQSYGKWLHHHGPAAAPTAETAAPAEPPEATPATPAAPSAERQPAVYNHGDASIAEPQDEYMLRKERFKALAREHERGEEIGKAMHDSAEIRAMVKKNIESGMSPEDTLKNLLNHLDQQAAPAPSAPVDPTGGTMATEPAPAQAAKAAPAQPSVGGVGLGKMLAARRAGANAAPAEPKPATPPSETEPLQTATAGHEDDIPLAPVEDEPETEAGVVDNFNMDAEGQDTDTIIQMIADKLSKYGRDVDPRKLRQTVGMRYQETPEDYPNGEEQAARELGAALVGDTFREFQKKSGKTESFRDKLDRFKRLLSEVHQPKKSSTQLLREHLSLN